MCTLPPGFSQTYNSHSKLLFPLMYLLYSFYQWSSILTNTSLQGKYERSPRLFAEYQRFRNSAKDWRTCLSWLLVERAMRCLRKNFENYAFFENFCGVIWIFLDIYSYRHFYVWLEQVLSFIKIHFL